MIINSKGELEIKAILATEGKPSSSLKTVVFGGSGGSVPVVHNGRQCIGSWVIWAYATAEEQAEWAKAGLKPKEDRKR